MEAIGTVMSIGQPISKVVAGGVGLFVSYTIVENAFANLLGLHTLRDGTNGAAWWGVQRAGLDPSFAQSGCHLYADRFGENIGDIYPNENPNQFQRFVNGFGRRKWLWPFTKRTASWGHGAIKGANAWKDTGPRCCRYLTMGFGALLGFCSPVVFVHMTPTDVDQHFERAEAHGGHIRLRTKDKENITVTTEYLGISGVFRQGLKDGWHKEVDGVAVGLWSRLKQDPSRPLFGAMQLTAFAWAVVVGTCAKFPGSLQSCLSPKLIQRSAVAAGLFAYLSR